MKTLGFNETEFKKITIEELNIIASLLDDRLDKAYNLYCSDYNKNDNFYINDFHNQYISLCTIERLEEELMESPLSTAKEIIELIILNDDLDIETKMNLIQKIENSVLVEV